MIACLKKFGPDGVEALGEYLQHHKLIISNATSRIVEVEMELSIGAISEEQKKTLKSEKRDLSGTVANAYENYYKAGGKLADLMQNILKHEEAPGMKKSSDAPKEPTETPAVFSTKAI